MIYLLTIAIIYGSIITYVSAISITAYTFNIPIRKISIGFGPAFVRLGFIQFGIIPLGGSVTLKDTREEQLPAHEHHNAMDKQPVWVQVSIALSGCIFLVVDSCIFMGFSGIQAFYAGTYQFFLGAISPLSTAQDLISEYYNYLSTGGIFAAYGLLCAKTAAINILPFPVTNGGYALLAIARPSKLFDNERVMLWLSIPYLLMTLVWLFSIVVYHWKNVT